MLSVIEARSSRGALLNLTLDDDSEAIFIENIDGLGPVKATLVSSSFANMDGAQYHSSRREPRNIKIKVGLDPDYSTESVQDLRSRLYDFFMPKTQVSLRFRQTSGVDVDIVGRIESCDPSIFSKDPAVDISIMCFDPDFWVPTPSVVEGFTTSTQTETEVDYLGTVETGIVFSLKVDRAISAFTFYLRPPDGSLRTLDFSAPLVAGDVLRINTAVGKKSVTRIRAGVETSVLYAQAPQSNWHEFQPGTNHIRVYAEGVPIPYSIEYTTKYGGL